MAVLLGVPELMSALEAGTTGRGRGADVFRIETRPSYAVTSDGGDFARWAAGAAEPDWSRKALTTDILRNRVAAGVTSRRIRLFTQTMTPYERFACEWAYAINGPAGEEIRVLRHGEHRAPDLLGFDYWLLNYSQVLRMHYDEEGAFRGAEDDPTLLPAVLAEHERLWRPGVAEPFDRWWARHPELHTRPVTTREHDD